MKFFNVDLNSESIRSGIIATNNDFPFSSQRDSGDSASEGTSFVERNSTPSPNLTPNSSSLGLNSSNKESVIHRLFRRSSAR